MNSPSNKRVLLSLLTVFICALPPIKYASAADNTPQPVKVTLYYDSFSADSRANMLDQIFPAYQKLAQSGILKLELVPYGNVQEAPNKSSWVFYCKHGADECLGNKMHACAIRYNPNQSVHVPLIECLNYYGSTFDHLPTCASSVKADSNQIAKCTNEDEGNQRLHEMGLKTKALAPAHQYIPWVTVNGIHTNEIQDAVLSDMLRYVCNAYTGTKPKECL